MTLQFSPPPERMRRFPDAAVFVALVLLGSVLLTLAAVHALCAMPGGGMADGP